MNVSIEAVVFGVLLLSLIVRWIPWRRLAERWVANDDNKGMVYVDIGSDVFPVHGWKILDAAMGQTYAYNWNGRVCEVDLPVDYFVKFVHGRRIIGAEPGRRTAKVPWFLRTGLAPQYSEPSVSALTATRVLAQLGASVTTGNPLQEYRRPLLVVLGVVVVLGLANYMGIGPFASPVVVPPESPPAVEERIDE